MQVLVYKKKEISFKGCSGSEETPLEKRDRGGS